MSDDGQLSRPISSLVALEELTERGSRQHRLLSDVFTAKEFPPGAFKTLVTLITEQAVFADAFRDHAADDVVECYEADQHRPEVLIATKMRQDAVTSTDEEIRVDEQAWHTNEATRLSLLQGTARDEHSIKIAEKGAQAGLPTGNDADLARALFEAGVSTAETVSDISGRGVGMSAVLGRCETLGGKIAIRSERGKGTTFAFSFPRRMNEHSSMPPAMSGRASRAPAADAGARQSVTRTASRARRARPGSGRRAN